MNQKIDTELSLSLSLSKEERMKNPTLSSGYEPETNLWKLILLYQGSLDDIQSELSFFAVPLIGNYAIIKIDADKIPALLLYPQILYLELPRPLYQEEITGINVSCFSNLPSFSDGSSSSQWTGKGVCIGILDSGVDFRHPDFCHPNGSSRILAYWDQTAPYSDNNRYGLGYIFSNTDLNFLLNTSLKISGELLQPSDDFSGHGTHIAGIAAGNGRNSNGKNRGVAPESSLIVVKLKNDADSVFTDYANLMMAVDFAIRFCQESSIPLSLNISYGSNDGPHDGTGLMERFLENCIFYGKNTVVIATGNEGISRRHSSLQLYSNETREVAFSVASGESSLYLQLWKSYADVFSYQLFLPGQENQITISGLPGIYRFEMNQNDIRLIISEPSPYQSLQEMFLVILPAFGQTFIRSGIWQLRILAKTSTNGQVNLWLPSKEATNSATGFLEASTDMTLTIPSTSSNVISVSGYDSLTDTFASFSGRGFSNGLKSKPDLTAPAVNILSTAPGGGYSIRTGTSMAAPFVAGASALFMQYGIIEGNDLFLYGEKIKALLQKGARPLPAFTTYPNASIGWGALCMRDSIPE